jgi:lantibiotic modifying enzyme
MENPIQTNNELLLRIVRHLIMHTRFLTDLGLYHGKMGIVLFFAHYARYSKESLYDEFAGELMNEIPEEIHADIPVNFESGLCGIGWGIEYLLQNGFMEGDSDEILSEIDKKVMERDVRRVEDTSTRTGLAGISYYVHKRLYSTCRKLTEKPFDLTYLSDWAAVTKTIRIPSDQEILSVIMEILPTGDDIVSWKYGLENGCAGIGLQNIGI